MEVRNVELYGVDWKNVNVDSLLELARNTNITIKGKIGLQNIPDSDKNKLLELEKLFEGQNIFDKNSDLHIYGPTSIYIFGPEDTIIYEGNNFQFRTIVFSENPGEYWYVSSAERDGVKLDSTTGYLTTVENGLPDEDVTVSVLFIQGDTRYSSEYKITIKKKIYPTQVEIRGLSEITEDTSYT